MPGSAMFLLLFHKPPLVASTWCHDCFLFSVFFFADPKYVHMMKQQSITLQYTHTTHTLNAQSSVKNSTYLLLAASLTTWTSVMIYRTPGNRPKATATRMCVLAENQIHLAFSPRLPLPLPPLMKVFQFFHHDSLMGIRAYLRSGVLQKKKKKT